LITPFAHLVPGASACGTARPWSQMPNLPSPRQTMAPSGEQASPLPAAGAAGWAEGVTGTTTMGVAEAEAGGVAGGLAEETRVRKVVGAGGAPAGGAGAAGAAEAPSKVGMPAALGQEPSLSLAGCSSTLPNLPGLGMLSTPLAVVHSPGMLAT